MSMQFKARAKSRKPCAFARCACMADKIYIDNKWKIMACSEAHANLARIELDKVPDEEARRIWPDLP